LVLNGLAGRNGLVNRQDRKSRQSKIEILTSSGYFSAFHYFFFEWQIGGQAANGTQVYRPKN
jgi:hypothetical protein